MTTPLTFLAAFIVVLALIALAAWLVRRFSGSNIGNNANRGRMPRLAVIDAAAVDGRRRLVLVRRDNVEHLLMIGGPTDVVVEPNIVRAMPARDNAGQRPGAPGELQPRGPALTDSPVWSEGDNRADDLDGGELAGDLTGRRSPPSFADEVRRPVLPAERRPGLDAPPSAPELPTRADVQRPEPRQDMRVDPGMPRPPRPPRPDGAPRPPRLSETLARLPRGPDAPPAAPVAAKPTPEAEKELTDMAQRLEAALRRPAAPPISSSAAATTEAAGETAGAPTIEVARPPRSGASAPQVSPPESDEAPPAAGRSGFENLEDEMASLLGRPKSPT